VIELVLIGFMLLAALNFARHFIAWQQKSLRTYLQDVEAARCCSCSASRSSW
jgi:trk system potassium uptake protein